MALGAGFYLERFVGYEDAHFVLEKFYLDWHQLKEFIVYRKPLVCSLLKGESNRCQYIYVHRSSL